MTFHEGEIAVQAQEGVQAMAERIGRSIHPAIPPIAQQFLSQQSLAVAASVDGDGRVWASMLAGTPGFITALDEHTLWINAKPVENDCLLENLKANPSIGLVVIQFSTRQRVRINGAASISPDGLSIKVHQAYSNCQKYIQARLPQSVDPKVTEAQHSATLFEVQKARISQADTFFIASYHPTGGADASHRGGYPGFIRVLNPTTLEFPDYSGNNMFNTLGNLVVNPHCGLLFMDFEQGHLLQLTGQAEVIWSNERTVTFPETQRSVRFHVKQVVEITNAVPFQYEFLQYSPFNAPVTPG